MSQLNSLAALSLIALLGATELAPADEAGSLPYRQRRALVIGINEYEDSSWDRLRFARSDAEAVGKKLEGLGFKVDYLLDRDATQKEIFKRFSLLRTEIAREDQVFIFFSGHGDTERTGAGRPSIGYIIPADARKQDSFGTAISMSKLRELSSLLQARHVMFAIDACFAGSLLTGRGPGGVRQRDPAFYREMARKPVRFVLTAGDAGQKAVEVDGRGLFSRQLLAALDGAAMPVGGGAILTGSDIASYVKKTVTDLAWQRYGAVQTPVSGDLEGQSEGEFLIAIARPSDEPSGAGTQTKIVPRVGSLSVRSPAENVLVWLDDKPQGVVGPAADLKIDKLPVGKHRLRAQARREGFKPWAQEIEIAENAERAVVIDIESLQPTHPPTLRGEDGAELVLVPAGPFWMGSSPAQIEQAVELCKRLGETEAQCQGLFVNELPRHRVTLAGFYIGRQEVTNAQFERFVSATGHRTLAEREGWGQDGKTEWAKVYGANWRAPKGAGAGAPADHPVVQVTWHDAVAYCRWAGKRLPTEAEWEKAARGVDGRIYPWGDAWDGSRTNGNLRVGTTSAVGSHPGGTSPFRAHDMAGNVVEWVADWYMDNYYVSSPTRNPPGPATGQLRSARGGSLATGPVGLRTAARGRFAPDDRSPHLGFRCAKDVP